MTDKTFVIIGASLAGAKAAETLRQDGFDGRIVLIGEEPVRPYERPPLSKDYLRGNVSVDKMYVHEEGYYAEQNIELRLSTKATTLDVETHHVGLAGGERIAWERLLLATGAAPRRLAVPGADLRGVFYLREMADSDGLRAAIQAADRLVVVGAGWIGCEVAASARQMGVHVAMVDVASYPLERVLGADLGRFYRDLHADNGVDLRLEVGIEEFRGSTEVTEVILDNGTVLPADLVLVGVGVVPRVELAQAAGLGIDNGVLTDEHLATTAPGVYAAGDVANAWHPTLGRRVRLEHWSAALNQGPVAARNMLDQAMPYVKIPYFFSDQYDVGMEYTGLASPGDEIVYRGDPASREFITFWLRDGRVTAGMNVNVWDVADDIAKLVATGRPVERASLADPAIGLDALAGGKGI